MATITIPAPAPANNLGSPQPMEVSTVATSTPSTYTAPYQPNLMLYTGIAFTRFTLGGASTAASPPTTGQLWPRS